MLKREFKKSYIERFGRDWVKAFTNKIRTPYPQYLRVNNLKITTSKLVNRLKKKGFSLKKIKGLSYGFRILEQPGFRISSTEEYLLGYFYLQDKASMLCVEELKPKKTDLILDAASAPGGKTTQLSQLINNQGVIIGVDVSKERLKAQLFNIQRLGVKNVASFHLNTLKIKKLGLRFDKVLLDAPCSASGTVWKEKKRLKAINKHVVKKHAELQKRLIKACAKVLKPKSRLLYATCSLEFEENEENTEYAEKELGLKLLKSKRFFPHTDDTIGFYYALLSN
jgi:NOL1/NOP2/sun family putative RNA methylase